MKYDFTSIIERKGKDAIAVDYPPFKGAVVQEGFDAIPMWVADMNFATVPTVMEAGNTSQCNWADKGMYWL